jgi:hypothetical protein
MKIINFAKENWFKLVTILFLLIISIELGSMMNLIHSDNVAIDQDIASNNQDRILKEISNTLHKIHGDYGY